jgi:hypothetical protein
MFNLENTISEWKRRVQQAESVTQDNVDELEEHLREAISGFIQKGLTEEEAFQVASMRLGEHAVLSKEYGKVNGTTVWRRRILWMLFGYVGGIALASGISGFSSCVSTLSAYLGYSGWPAGAAAVIAGLVSWTMAISLMYFRTRKNVDAPENDFISAGWLAVMVAVIVTGASIRLVGNSLHAQMVSSDQFGMSVWWATIGGLVLQSCMIAACVGIILRIRERSPNQSRLNLE